MKILINNKVATLKKGTSFEFVAENRSFTGSDGYTLSITFPLRGCPNNIAIFGNIARADVDKSKVLFDCEIHDLNFTKYGSMTIIEVSDAEVKTQFLEGRSEQNFDDTFDEIYINEIDLGEYPIIGLPPSGNPSEWWKGIYYNQRAVALPWVNNASGNIQNEVVYNSTTQTYAYHSDCRGLSFQFYLIELVERLCRTLGYDIVLFTWYNHPILRYLLVCNALPYTWYIYRIERALPHWTVTEFFEKLERFLGCEFNIDHKHKKIDFAFTDEIIADAPPITLDKVVDEYTAEVTADDDSNYIELANVRYSTCDHRLWNFYSCRWFIEQEKDNALEYDTLDELITANDGYKLVRSFGRGSNAHKLLYARDVDTYFVIRSIGTKNMGVNQLTGNTIYYQVCILQPVNVFGDYIVDEENGNEIELDFVPAWIDETEASKGRCLFLDIASYDEENTSDDGDSDIRQPQSTTSIEAGEQDQKAEYYDKIFFAFWDGEGVNAVGKLPCPILDKVTVREDWVVVRKPFSMRPSDRGAVKHYNINAKQKYQFKFLANEIPNIRSLFFIKGKKYLCEKITATFTENGMSQLLKGNFYQVTN